ncbi:MAG: helix-turn-helix domain-containing protein [Pseudomonadota bacterium]
MTIYYCHITAKDRIAIMMMQATHSIRAIATYLRCAPSTVSRELPRIPSTPSSSRATMPACRSTGAAWRVIGLFSASNYITDGELFGLVV